MRRRRVRRPDWWPNPKHDLERVLVERVVASLQAEGRVVADVWSPEHEPDDPRLAGRTTRPEAALSIDGRSAAIDVTGFWTTERGKAANRATAIGRTIKAAIEAADLRLCALAMLIYRPGELVNVDDPEAQAADAARIAEALLAVARRPDPVQRLELDLAGLPSWLDRLSVTTVDWSARPDVIALPRRWPRDVGQTLDAIAANKGHQLAAWGLGIVAILRGLDESAAEIAAHLATRDDWPFWRVYWCDAGDAHLVWAAAGSGARSGTEHAGGA